MSRIAYDRVSTHEQSVEAQRTALGGAFDRKFIDEAVRRITESPAWADRRPPTLSR